MKLTIRTYPDPVLAQKAAEIGEMTPALRELAANMAETMYGDSGIGLAAPQVGESIRMVVVDVTGPENKAGLMTLINPRIVASEGEVDSEEGCLSLPNLRCTVTRKERVTVQALDLDGKSVTIEADELLAVCLQHELDHLDGVILVDRISRLKRLLYDKKVKKWQKKATDD
ncbi:MAG: peptide deformylase [Desulfovibrionaceae bacterium]